MERFFQTGMHFWLMGHSEKSRGLGSWRKWGNAVWLWPNPYPKVSTWDCGDQGPRDGSCTLSKGQWLACIPSQLRTQQPSDLLLIWMEICFLWRDNMYAYRQRPGSRIIVSSRLWERLSVPYGSIWSVAIGKGRYVYCRGEGWGLQCTCAYTGGHLTHVLGFQRLPQAAGKRICRAWKLFRLSLMWTW